MIITITWEERFEYVTSVEVTEDTFDKIVLGDIDDEAVLQLAQDVNAAQCESWETELLAVEAGGEEVDVEASEDEGPEDPHEGSCSL